MRSMLVPTLVVGVLFGGTAIVAEAQRANTQAAAVPTYCWTCNDEMGNQTSKCNWLPVQEYGQSTTRCNTVYNEQGVTCTPLGTLCGSPWLMSLEGSATQPVLLLGMSVEMSSDGSLRDCEGRILSRQYDGPGLGSGVPQQVML